MCCFSTATQVSQHWANGIHWLQSWKRNWSDGIHSMTRQTPDFKLGIPSPIQRTFPRQPLLPSTIHDSFTNHRQTICQTPGHKPAKWKGQA